MGKYLAFFKISLKKSLAYRLRLLVWFLWEIGPALIMLFFWLAVFANQDQVGNYNFYSLVIYYLVIIFARNLVLTHPDIALQKEIYNGEINIYLPRPADLITIKFVYEIAYKFLKFLYLIPTLIICYLVFLSGRHFDYQFLWPNLTFFLFSCSLSFCLYFLIKFLIGILSFWLTEIEWLDSLEMLIFWFFGGLLLPLDLFPKSMQNIAGFLPFKYIFYLPAQGLLGRLNQQQMLTSLLIQGFWLLLFFILVKKIYQRGLKIYSVFGG